MIIRILGFRVLQITLLKGPGDKDPMHFLLRLPGSYFFQNPATLGSCHMSSIFPAVKTLLHSRNSDLPDEVCFLNLIRVLGFGYVWV